jgi:AAA15 family ATPase/GTPase
MKNTNPIFSLKNFRSFGEEGADFELAPITVLTGCN